MWRWCRRGVLARSGKRIKLQHIRVGGKIFTTAEWVIAFGRHLADADAQYFEARIEPSRCTDIAPDRRQHLNRINRELEDAGL